MKAELGKFPLLLGVGIILIWILPIVKIAAIASRARIDRYNPEINKIALNY